MRSNPRHALFLVLAVALVAPTAAAQRSTAGTGDTTRVGSPLGEHRAQARGDGNFALFVDELSPPVGARLGGIVDPRLTAAALPHFVPASYPGALVRTEVRMHLEANLAGFAGAMVSDVHAQGLRAMLTFVGTPADNSPFPQDQANYWKYPPVDAVLWAEELIEVLQEMQADAGQLPDFVKIWNEPEREETYLGTRAEFVAFFTTVLARLQQAVDSGELPAGSMQFGGPGMADWDSPMDGTGPVLFELIEACGAQGLPLDFVCWHEYFRVKPANALRYYEPVERLRAAGAAAGYPALGLYVDEWNIYPSAFLNENAVEMDSYRGAATSAIFLAAVAKVDLDGAIFFQLQDVDPQAQILDLTGAGNGVLTRRGVKKPCFRVMELAQPMLAEDRIRVQYPQNEWAAGVFATRAGNRVRVIVANDPVRSEWAWSQGCRERGGDPGRWWSAYQTTDAAGPVTVDTLQEVGGLELWEAMSVLQVIYYTGEADNLETAPRTMLLSLRGVDPAAVELQYPVWLFDDQHNDPVDYRDELLPLLNWVEIEARRGAFERAVEMLDNRGYGTAAEFDPEQVLTSAEEFATFFAVPQEVADEAFPYYVATLEDGRVAHVGLLNSQPATVLYDATPAEAGISYAAGVIKVTLQPAAAVVFDFTF